MLHRIQNIIDVRPYTVLCTWTNGETRLINLSEILKDWAVAEGSIFRRLLEKEIFMNVALNPESRTLAWPDMLIMKDSAGATINAPLDLDPEVLYELSEPSEMV